MIINDFILAFRQSDGPAIKGGCVTRLRGTGWRTVGRAKTVTTCPAFLEKAGNDLPIALMKKALSVLYSVVIAL